LADSCRERLRKGSAVLIDGELQSRSWKTEDGHNRTIVEIKAKRIQFLNKFKKNGEEVDSVVEDSLDDIDYQESSFDKFLTDEESNLIKD